MAITSPSEFEALQNQLMEKTQLAKTESEVNSLVHFMDSVQTQAEIAQYQKGVPKAYELLRKAYLEGIELGEQKIPPIYQTAVKLYQKLAGMYIEAHNTGDQVKVEEIEGYMSKLQAKLNAYLPLVKEILNTYATQAEQVAAQQRKDANSVRLLNPYVAGEIQAAAA